MNYTLGQLKNIRNQYVGKYIGDPDKPTDYQETLDRVDRDIRLKEIYEEISLLNKKISGLRNEHYQLITQ